MATDSISSTRVDNQYDIRPATDVIEAKKWFMQELDWNRSSYDLATYISASISKGLLLILPKSTNSPEGHIMATIYNNSTGWVTMFIVSEQHRGLGYGRALFNEAMEEFTLNGTSIVGLDGVTTQKNYYERRGFVESSFGRIRCMARDLLGKTPLPSSSKPASNTRLLDVKDLPPELFVQSDLQYTGFERKSL